MSFFTNSATRPGAPLASLAPVALVLALAWALAGCGALPAPSGAWPGKDKVAAAGSTAPADSSGAGGTAGSSTTPSHQSLPAAPVSQSAPLETYLAAGTLVPSRLKAGSLVLHFYSNDAEATFDCQPGGAVDWTPCAAGGGPDYDFGNLVDLRGYTLKVRAHAADGRLDTSPLQVTFVCDLTTGTAPTFPAAGGSSVTASTVPTPIIPQSIADLPVANSDGIEGRSLQVGTYYAVVVPGGSEVTSYSTTKTYNGELHSMRLMNATLSSVYPNDPCTQDFERIVQGPTGADYCDATPNETEWQAAYGQGQTTGPMPKNHIEMVSVASDGVMNERLLVAAFDPSDADPSQGHLGIQSACQNAFTSGSSFVPMLTSFYDLTPQGQTFSWCEVKDAQNTWWWIGTFTASIGSGPAASQLTILYTLNARMGTPSGPEFGTYAGSRLPQLLLPIAPAKASQ